MGIILSVPRRSIPASIPSPKLKKEKTHRLSFCHSGHYRRNELHICKVKITLIPYESVDNVTRFSTPEVMHESLDQT